MTVATPADPIMKLIQQGDLDSAEKQLKATAGQSQSSAHWHMLMGQLQIRKGQIEKGITTLEDGLQLDPSHRDLRFLLAFAYDLYGEDEKAVYLYEKLAEESPVHVNALMNFAILCEDEGDYEQAKHLLLQILDHYPNHKRAQLFLKDVESSLDMFYDEETERDRLKRNAVLDIPISDFELSVRSRNCLKKMNINSLGDLLRTSEVDLLSYKNFGETSLNEIKIMLRQKGLRLGQMVDDKSGNITPVDASILPPGADPAVLSKSVSELEFSVRSRKCLQRLGITTIGELAMKSEVELLSSKNFGQTSLTEVKQRLAEFGLSLRKTDSSL